MPAPTDNDSVEPESSSDEDVYDTDDEAKLVEVTTAQIPAQYAHGVNVSEWMGMHALECGMAPLTYHAGLDLYQQSSIDKWGGENLAVFVQIMRLQWKRDRWVSGCVLIAVVVVMYIYHCYNGDAERLWQRRIASSPHKHSK